MPTSFVLKQHYPKPFNSQTIIEVSIPKSDNYTLSTADVLGRIVDVAYSGFLESGSYKIDFYAGKLSSGVYFYTLRSDNYSSTKKFVLIK